MKTYRAFLCFAIILITPLFAHAQKQANIWYFGYGAGLDFNNGGPTPLSNGQTYSPDGTAIECSATISDSSGALLFYTNGQRIWNKNQQIMPDGDSLLSDFSSTQGALIVPQPGSSRYFYVFTVDDFYEDGLRYGFRYSIVDICADNGLGNVMPAAKNIKTLDTVCEKLTAVHHANGIDYWIIVHKYFSDAFYAYRLTAAGIVDSVITQIGSRHPSLLYSYQGPGSALGQLKASPDGNKLAIVNGNAGAGSVAEYFDFDRNSGVISNWVNLQWDTAVQRQYQYYGTSFSPDNSKLYVASWLNGNGIYQYDLNAGGGNPDSVRNSRIKIAGNGGNYEALQLATNGKIYVTRAPDNGRLYLGAINYPNAAGVLCNYQDSAMLLNGYSASMGLPNFIDAFDYRNASYVCENNCDFIINGNENICAGDTGYICAQPGFSSYAWSTGDTTACIHVTDAGTYAVTVNENTGCTASSNSINIRYYPHTSVAVRVHGDSLIASMGMLSYQWRKDGTPIPGATSSIYIMNSGGDYTLQFTDSNGCPGLYDKGNVFTGIQENQIEGGINIFPNPTNTGWQLSVTSELIGSMVEVYDATGRLVFKSIIENQQSSVNFTNAASGVYQLRINWQGYSFVKKLIKL